MWKKQLAYFIFATLIYIINQTTPGLTVKYNHEIAVTTFFPLQALAANTIMFCYLCIKKMLQSHYNYVAKKLLSWRFKKHNLQPRFRSIATVGF
jgi:hypothetical protein